MYLVGGQLKAKLGSYARMYLYLHLHLCLLRLKEAVSSVDSRNEGKGGSESLTGRREASECARE